MDRPVIAVQIEPASERVFVSSRGDISARDVMGAMELMYRDPRFRSRMTKLWDLQRAHLVISSHDVHDIVSFAARRPESGATGRTAIVVARDADYGMIRIAQVHAEQMLGTEITPFRAVDDAEHWLRDRADTTFM